MPADLTKYLGHSVNTVSPKELETLRSVYTTIDQGEASWVDYLAQAEERTPEDPKPEIPVDTSAYDNLVEEQLGKGSAIRKRFDEYVAEVIGASDDPEGVLKLKIADNWEQFYVMFENWMKKKPAKKTPPKKTTKRVADMNDEERTLYRIGKASEKTLEGVVRNNWEWIEKYKSCTEKAMEKWGKYMTKPWPGIKSEVVRDNNLVKDNEINVAEEIAATIKSAEENFGKGIVSEAAAVLDIDLTSLNLAQANVLYDRALELYNTGA
jgi:hypothetical protein